MVKKRFVFFLPLSMVLLGGLLAGARLSSASKFEAYMPVEQREDRLASRLREGSRAVLLRQLVVESLERLLIEQHRFRSIHGRFTRNLSRLDWDVLRETREAYEFTVVEASQDRLLVTATSEASSSMPADVLSIDQDARVHASFLLPSPRAEYLRERAQRILAASPGTEDAIYSLSSRQGPWAGYFEVTQGEAGDRVAVGTKVPVLGERLGPRESAGEFGGTPPTWGLREALGNDPGSARADADRELMRFPASWAKPSIPPEEPLVVEPLQ